VPRRGGWVLVAIVVVVLGLATIPGVIHRQILGLGASDIHDVATLPERISVCGRSWHRDITGRVFSGAEMRELPGGGPPLVDPLPFAPCPPGPCSRSGDNTPCATVVAVRVGEDAYVDYALSGGP